jgi:hypothetical protein
MAQRPLRLLQGEWRLAARTHGTAQASLAHNTQPAGEWKHLNLYRRVETLKPGHRGGDELKPLRHRGLPQQHNGGDKLKPLCRPERNTHGPEPFPVRLVCCRARGLRECCCTVQRGSQLRQLRQLRPRVTRRMAPSAVGSQRPCALAADCAPEVSPSLVSPRSFPTVTREIGQHRKVETLRLGTEVVMTSNLCADSRNNLPLHTQRR